MTQQVPASAANRTQFATTVDEAGAVAEISVDKGSKSARRAFSRPELSLNLSKRTFHLVVLAFDL